MIYSSADEMFRGLLTAVLWHGRKANARNGKETLDIEEGWKGVLSNPRRRFISCPVRGMREGYPAASVAWNLMERNDVESICKWNPFGRAISDDGSTFYGANYGERWLPALIEAMELLRQQDGSRRAWVPIWKEDDITSGYSRQGKDVPCTIGFGLRLWEIPTPVAELERWERETGEHRDAYPVQSHELSMSVAMRSQSAWGVFPYDLYLFSVMHELIANDLGASLGRLHWDCVLSAHVFSEELIKVKESLKLPVADTPTDLPIEHDLKSARTEYGSTFDSLLAGQHVEPQSDPVLAQMISGRPAL